MRLHIEELRHEENEVLSWQLQDAQDYQAQKGGTLGRALVNLGFVKAEEVAGLLARRYGLPSIDLDPLTVDPAIVELVPEESRQAI